MGSQVVKDKLKPICNKNDQSGVTSKLTSTINLKDGVNQTINKSKMKENLNRKIYCLVSQMNHKVVESVNKEHQLNMLVPFGFYHTADKMNENRLTASAKYFNSVIECLTNENINSLFIEPSYCLENQITVPINKIYSELTKEIEQPKQAKQTNNVKTFKLDNKDAFTRSRSKESTIESNYKGSTRVSKSPTNKTPNNVANANKRELTANSSKPNAIVKIDLTAKRNKLNTNTHSSVVIKSKSPPPINKIKVHSHAVPNNPMIPSNSSSLYSVNSNSNSIKSVPDSIKSYGSGSYLHNHLLKKPKEEKSLNRSYTTTSLTNQITSPSPTPDSVPKKEKIVFSLDLSAVDNIKTDQKPKAVPQVNEQSSKLNKLKSLKLNLENKIKSESPFEVKEVPGKLDTIRESLSNEGEIDEKFSLNKRSTPKFNVFSNKTSTSNEERFSFNQYRTHEDKINLNFNINDKIEEDELKNLDYLDESI